MSLQFPIGSENDNTQCISIDIIDDVDVEGDEVFTVQLNRLVGTIRLPRGETIVTITDNEGLY